jgi:hypothetical protein
MTKPFVVLSWLCAACVAVGEEPEPEPPPEPDTVQSCDDPRYRDGVCNLDLACEAPDIDCYRTFADDTLAALWYAKREAEDVPTLLTPSDPRFVRMRALLDAVWKTFSKARQVASLAELRPALVMIDDPTANAFTAAESATQRQVFAVMVNTGLETALTEDAVFGVLGHELQHIVGLHGVGDVDEDLRIHYVVDGVEPIGRLQTDNAAVHGAIGLAEHGLGRRPVLADPAGWVSV